jgi:hypothetical protein
MQAVCTIIESTGAIPYTAPFRTLLMLRNKKPISQ